MSVDFCYGFVCVLKVAPVPRASTPTPQRFPETRAYYLDILTTSGTDVTAQLVAFWSKALLRHPHARSSLEEMTTDTAFQRYIPDSHPDNLASPDEIRRHILCTGPYS